MRPAPVLRHRRPELIDRAAPRGLRPPAPIPQAGIFAPEALATFLGAELAQSATTVTDTTVSGLAAVQAAVDLVSHAVASMLVEAEVFNARGELVPTPTVIARPSSLMPAFEWYTGLVAVTIMRGNGLAVLADFDATGQARQLVPTHPDAVALDVSKGVPEYTINGQGYDFGDVLHVRHGAAWGSLWGRGVIERYRSALQRQLAESEWSRSGFMSGGVPSAVISLDKDVVTNDEAETVQERWIDRHTSGTRKPAVIGKLMKVEPISWTPEDAEYVEARKTSVAEAALMVGLHPADLGASLGGSLDYTNLTDRQLARLMHSFQPWARSVEEAMSDLLPAGHYVRAKAEALLKVSTKERYEIYTMGKALGLWTDEELREEERRPRSNHPDPIEPDDDVNGPSTKEDEHP
ncbi:MAG TPA: phage portal protein [Ilumatobacter sp.]|nr:phage portal protein [Ilumatobacter sp.]